MSSKFELPFVPFVVFIFMMSIWIVSVLIDIETVVDQPPPKNSNWIKNSEGNIQRVTPRDPVWEPLFCDR